MLSPFRVSKHHSRVILCFRFSMHMLNTVLWGRQCQTLNGYFLVNNGNEFKFSTATEKLTPENGASKKWWETVLSIDGENLFFSYLSVTFSNLRHSQFSTEDTFLKLKGGNLFGNLQTILPTWFTFS